MSEDIYAKIYAENQRILASIAAVGDYLYKGDTTMALTIIESLVNGDTIETDNLDQSQLVNMTNFSRQFNQWCFNHRLTAGWLALLPSQRTKGHTSVQVGGSKKVCDLLEALHKGVQ